MNRYFNCIVLGWLLVGNLALALTQEYPNPKSSSTINYIPSTFQSADHLTLHGHIALPSGKAGPFPTVLLLVGSGAGNRYGDIPSDMTSNHQPALLFQGIETALVQSGIAVYSYDKRGVIPKDDTFLDNTVTSDYQTATAKNLASDALNAFDHLKSFPQVDSSRIALLGHSEGTALAMKISEQRPEVTRFHGLEELLDCGFVNTAKKGRISIDIFHFVVKFTYSKVKLICRPLLKMR